ncbi:hypothetical protein PQR70_37210 [Paraburkholderia madseniana]|uniref:hypothetical protein n=1 Tax=Paraburkholderia madseniana TaxID=2599607 RepID=UPI0038B6C24A
MDYESLRVGEIDPELNKVVTKMVIQHHDFVVYLDEELDTQWHVREVGDPVRFGKVLNAVADVELRSDFLRDDERTFTRVRLLAGEALARVIDDRDEDAGMNAIQHAEAIISKRNAELSRRWYYLAAQRLVLAFIAFAAFAWVTRNWLPWNTLLGRTTFQFIFCSVAGAVGALISIITRSHSIELDAMSGELAHQIESRARIVTGMVAASAFGLATKLGWLSIFHGNPDSLTFLVLLGLVCGASERAVPNFLSRFDPAGERPHGAGKHDGKDETRVKPST